MENILVVKRRKNPADIINTAKSILEAHFELILQGVGFAMPQTLLIANELVALGFCALKKIETGNVTEDKLRTKTLLTFVLQRAPDF
jgi:hypothetical protein